MEGFPDYPVRFFQTDPVDRRTKFHQSQSMVEQVQARPADAYVIKGVDGGIGTHLIRKAIAPSSIPYVSVTGGAFYHPTMRGASAVLYESTYQRDRLIAGSWLRPRVQAERLIHLHKSVDLDVFRPHPNAETRYDVVTACRIDQRNKSFSELGDLSKQLRIAIAGSGPDEEILRDLYPTIEWMGRIPNRELSAFYAQSRLFLHNGKRDRTPTRDFYPRVLAEAMASGSVCLAFDDVIQSDVLPGGCGYLVSRENLSALVDELIKAPETRHRTATQARNYAISCLGKRSSRPALQAALALI